MRLNEFENLAKRELSQSTEHVDVDKLLVDLKLKKQNGLSYFLTRFSIIFGVALLSGFVYMNQRTDAGTVQEVNSLNLNSQKSSLNTQQTETILNASEINTTITEKPTASIEKVETKLSSKKADRTSINLRGEIDTNNDALSISQYRQTTNVIDNNLNRSQVYTSATNETKFNQEVELSSNVQTSHIVKANNSIFKENAIQGSNVRSMATNLDLLKPIELEAIMPLATQKIGFGKKPQHCPDFGGKDWFLAVVPEIGLDYNMKTLEIDDVEFEDLLNLRNENERTLEGYQFGLSLMGYHRTGIYVKGGAAYSKFTEQMKLNRTYTEMDTTIGIVSITESQSGDTLTVIYGDIITTKEITENRKIHYNFSMIDIPLAIGYGFNMGSFNLDLEAGAMFNIKTTTRGKYFSEQTLIDNNFEDLDNTNRFKRTLGVGFFASALIRKELSNGSAVYLGPRFKIRPTQYSTNFNPVNQRYKTVGLYAGYIHRF